MKLIYAGQGRGIRLPEALSLGEGGTPSVELSALAQTMKLGRLTAKLEWCNPTGSHKDRMSARLIARALSCNVPLVVAASSGNGGLSIAAYSAHAGLPTEIALTAAVAQSYRRAMVAHGARLIEAPDSLGRWEHLARRVAEGAFAATNYRLPAIGTDPFGIEGYKTLAAELAGLDRPDVVIVPSSRGDLLSGLRLGFEEIGGVMPRLVAVEPFPRLARVMAGEDYRSRFEGHTAQVSTAGETVTFQALAALRASSGLSVPVDDMAARRAQATLAACGLHAELSAAAALTALDEIARDGRLAGRHVTLVLTGSGLRDPGAHDPASWPHTDERPHAATPPAMSGFQPPRTEASVQQRDNG
ncbi:pyridoxal-phosphate dependent enzyme [Bosea sp. (in: a-proteobacteria)]|uniref:pyridoxal-phosphate dependent enzyme n=1 Tax=Bosea sp. (in: a-proteobacteria) TaxID=1871050 RepID=UPI002735176E|nr:pyridoxal-phosphate dependent enzyme [Bosea sp. (in: a-proteobacteria)]MDP3254551.1 pyridoxal-phosphate dependent enzyme [Bosea sp. (in: a-proteobacteria)]